MANSPLETIASGKHRSAQNVARNGARHPVETLEFFGLKPDMTVLEILPAGFSLRAWRAALDPKVCMSPISSSMR
jgi:predicted methyltransferase